MSTVDEADAARIRARYPQPRAGRGLRLVVTAALALVLLGWLAWAGWHGATPPVTADVHGFRILGPNQAEADLRVQRRDPGRAAVCTLQATAENFVQVGELDATIAPGTERITRATVDIRTVNRATTVTVKGCRNA